MKHKYLKNVATLNLIAEKCIVAENAQKSVLTMFLVYPVKKLR